MVPSTLTALRGTWGTERNTGFRLDSVLCRPCACSSPASHNPHVSAQLMLVPTIFHCGMLVPALRNERRAAT